jgi:indolepyruvate ferredoxin oxidoreductase
MRPPSLQSSASSTAANYDIAVEIVSLPEQMCGYGHVQAANVARAKQREAQLMAHFRSKAARAA